MPQTGRTLLYDGLAQNDVDMAHHRLLNLDTSNLPPVGIPPTVHPPDNEWLHDWDATAQTWTSTRPRFLDISGFLTRAQQDNIAHLGTVTSGIWNASTIDRRFLPSLDLITAPVGNVSMAGHRLINLANPVDQQDAITLAYLEATLPGLQPKEAVKCASTGHVSVLSGYLTIDGVTLGENDRVLLKNQNTSVKYKNGIWIVHSGAWTRPTDFDGVPNDTELLRAAVFVMGGTANAGTTLVQITPSPVSLVEDIDPTQPHAPVFVIFSAVSASILPGLGLNKILNTLNVVGTAGRILVGATVNIDPAYIGQNSITTLGTITSGTWHGALIDPARGGTGVNNGTKTITLLGDVSTYAPLDTPDVSGNRTLSFALTDNTNVRLPTAGILATTNGVETFSNKRIQKRTQSIVSSPKPAIPTDSVDCFHITSLSDTIASMTDNLTGTPFDGQELVLWIRDNGVSRNITWGSAWTASTDLSLPLITSPGVMLFLGFIFNIENSKWVLTQKLNNIL